MSMPSHRLWPARRAHLATTTTSADDSLSPRRRSGERVRERGFQKSATSRWNEPLSPLVPRGERGQVPSAMVGVSRCAPARLCFLFLLLLSLAVEESLALKILLEAWSDPSPKGFLGRISPLSRFFVLEAGFWGSWG